MQWMSSFLSAHTCTVFLIAYGMNKFIYKYEIYSKTIQVLFIHDKKVEIIGASVNQEKTLLGELGTLLFNFLVKNLILPCMY
jgi:hypothetical protein